MPHLTENEVVQFYAAYRAMEATASSLRNEVERLRQKTIKVEVERGLADGARLLQGSGAVCHRAQFLAFVLVTLYLGFVFYLFYLALP